MLHPGRVFRSICCTLTLSVAASFSASSATAAPPGEGTLLVGAASRSVLPFVNGSLDYMKAALPGRADATDPGILVPEWDDGRIAVGNGESVSYWVRDDVRADRARDRGSAQLRHRRGRRIGPLHGLPPRR